MAIILPKPAKLAGTNSEIPLTLVAFAARETVAVDCAFTDATRMAETKLFITDVRSVGKLDDL